MPSYRIGKLKGRFVVSIYSDAGQRTHRYRLAAGTAREAELEAPGIVHELTKPKGSTVAELWRAFREDKKGRVIATTMLHTFKAIEPRFGHLHADDVTVEHCRAYTAARRRKGIKDGSIATELGHLRMALKWAEKHRLIARAPHIERPTPPKRTERHLTREQCRAMIEAATMPHIRLYIIVALATGARNGAILDLTWSRCDFERGMIDLRNPAMTHPHKGRAVVPMNRTVRAALIEARDGALSDHVIEWAGRQVGSVKRGLKATAKAAGISGSVHPHLFRHSVAVHMAERGIGMEEIAQYLGHDDVGTTREVYARFSPVYLRGAAAVLEYDDLAFAGSSNLEGTSRDDPKGPLLLENDGGRDRDRTCDPFHVNDAAAPETAGKRRRA